MKIKHVKTILVLLTVAAIVSFSSCGRTKTKKDGGETASATEKVMLFNGKDLSNWTFFLRDPSADASEVFTIKNGVIHISGDPFGYMRTGEVYGNYALHVEWRYPTEATNSGVFIHVQQPDTIWPKCFEVQLKAGNAGDLLCMGGSDMNERTDKSTIIVAKLAESAEKPVGEWNKMEITCISDNIDVTLNDVLMNRATGTSLKEGHICLQSEGRAIEFRNVWLTRLKE
ncbi:MAG TPA: DUF1080 domain-containing protein [Bacteroidales bacterium]|jgi:hypothetical protein|nr:DUF1080 domain-containing protein [Bacteroidales bacterium]HOS71848.1 DUF1080 domain-containing protein [Bacteroidales bacterium]HQH24978.1 DUF1080 domain-containing protein [Bacteroidales bacterium]HQJ82611.1 DUF1080 domain-containing protein [Bacteroidales bacterium]